MAEYSTASIQLTRSLTKTPDEVFRELTHGITNWWPKDYYIGTYEGVEPVGLTFEDRVGGHFVEDWGDGQGLVWATVIVCRRPLKLVTVGDSSPQWGGPNRAFTEYALAEKDGGTELSFRHEPHGTVNAGTVEELEKGWCLLLDCLVAWVERGEHPVRPASVVKGS